jgi:hypothetical protein
LAKSSWECSPLLEEHDKIEKKRKRKHWVVLTIPSKLSTPPKEKKSFVATRSFEVGERTRVVNIKNRSDNPRVLSLILITVHH